MDDRERILAALESALPGVTKERIIEALESRPRPPGPETHRDLRERMKELTAMHATVSILLDERVGDAEALGRVATILPSAFLHDSDARARVVHGPETYATPGFTDTPWRLSSPYRTCFGVKGKLEVVYLHDHPLESEGPFLLEERRLVDSLASLVAVALDSRRTLEHLRAVLNTGSVRLWEWDIAAGRVTWPGLFLDGFRKSLTLTYEETLQRIHPEDREPLRRKLDTLVADPSREGRLVVELRGALPGRPYTWRHVTGYLFRNVEGRPDRMVGISTDLSAQRELLDRLRQAEKMEALGRLAGGVAHDFNNVLSAILGFAHLAREQLPSKDPAQNEMTEIINAAQSAAQVVRQILAFSRRQELRPRTVDLRSAIAESETLLRTLLGSQVKIRTECMPDTPQAVVDPGQLYQVLLNLAVNARDAMPQGGTLTIRAGRRRCGAPQMDGSTGQPKDWAVIDVQDTGVGMAPEVRDRIFEPFFTTKEEGKGTGLGLATVHGIVTQSGGFLEVLSEVGIGTLFRAHFPPPS